MYKLNKLKLNKFKKLQHRTDILIILVTIII